MDSRAALAVAVASALLAVGIVAADLQFGVDIQLETIQNGEWIAFADANRNLYDEPYLRGGCAGPDLRVVVDNQRLIGAESHVHVSYWDRPAGQTVVVLDEVWDLERGEKRAHEFTIPAAAFAPQHENQTFPEQVYVDVRVGDEYLGGCVSEVAQ